MSSPLYKSIIFTDIDGVLNTSGYLDSIEDDLKKLCEERFDKKGVNIMTTDNFQDLIDWAFIRIDPSRLDELRELANETNSKVVLISSWSTLYFISLIMLEFRKRGIPVIGHTKDDSIYRGTGVRNYVEKHNVEDYVLIDDQMSVDYTDEILEKLVKTDEKDGLTKEKREEAKKILTKKLNRRY